jgi:hypothetical protein
LHRQIARPGAAKNAIDVTRGAAPHCDRDRSAIGQYRAARDVQFARAQSQVREKPPFRNKCRLYSLSLSVIVKQTGSGFLDRP